MTTMTETMSTSRDLPRRGLIGFVARRVAEYRETRRLLAHLEAMEDHILVDIGLTRADVVRARLAQFGSDRVGMLGIARTRRSS